MQTMQFMISMLMQCKYFLFFVTIKEASLGLPL